MDEYMTVTLTLDNDEVVECAVLTIFSANGQDYIALLPLDEKGEPGQRCISVPLHRKRSG